MFRSSSFRIVAITAAVLVALGLLHARPWQHSGAASAPAGARQQLAVGFLPVT